MLDLQAIPIVDNHCHAYVRVSEPYDLPLFRRVFSEAGTADAAQKHTQTAVYYRWALKELGRVLHCAANEEEVLAKRGALTLAELTTLLLAESNIEIMLIDTGLGGPEFLTVDEMRTLTGCRIEWMLRLEVLAQQLIVRSADFASFSASLDDELQNLRKRGIVSLKSIAAYRCGLDLHPVSENEAQAAFEAVRSSIGADGKLRLTHKTLIEYIVHQGMSHAAKQGGIPIQFHTGYGDPDTDLRLGNPLHLRGLFENPDFATVPIVMLHESYPFTREAAYLAAVYDNAYLDISYSVPYLDYHELLACTHQALGAAPWSKVMYSSDGHTIPEHGWLGAIHGRKILADALEQKIQIGELSHDEALEAAAAILHGNARRVYALE